MDMALTYRTLPPEEFDRLKGHPFFADHADLSKHALVLVAEVGGTIISFWEMVPTMHIKSAWTAPEWRGRISTNLFDIAVAAATKLLPFLSATTGPAEGAQLLRSGFHEEDAKYYWRSLWDGQDPSQHQLKMPPSKLS